MMPPDLSRSVACELPTLPAPRPSPLPPVRFWFCFSEQVTVNEAVLGWLYFGFSAPVLLRLRVWFFLKSLVLLQKGEARAFVLC